MDTRPAMVWAMSCALLGGIPAAWAGPPRRAAQEPKPPSSPPEEPMPDAPQEPQAPGEQDVKALEERAVGPTPGAPTVSLAQAVTIALERNFSILSAADGLEAARFGESAAVAEFYPKLTPRYLRSSEESTLGLDASQRLPWTGGSVSASASFRRLTAEELASTRFSDIRLVFTQPLLRGFGPNAAHFNRTNSRRARQGQERFYELARQSLAVDVTRAFHQVVKQRQLLEVARQSLERSRSLLEASEARIKVGLASKLDVFRAELRVAEAQGSMVSFQAGLETSLEQFRFLLGLGPTDPVEPEAVVLEDDVEGEIEPLEALLPRALESRLDLQESRDRAQDARRAVSLARQRLLPQVDVSVGLTRSGFGRSFSESLKGTDTRVDVFLSTSYPIERSAEQVNKAVAELEQAARERSLRQHELEIEAEVRAAVRELDRIRKSIELQRKGVEFAEKQHRLATLRYQRGLASNFDVVDAEGNLVSARTSLVGLLTDYRVALVQLQRVTGALDVSREFAP